MSEYMEKPWEYRKAHSDYVNRKRIEKREKRLDKKFNKDLEVLYWIWTYITFIDEQSKKCASTLEEEVEKNKPKKSRIKPKHPSTKPKRERDWRHYIAEWTKVHQRRNKNRTNKKAEEEQK